jgi:hypothetical protein
MGEHCRLASRPLHAPSAPCPPAPWTGRENEGRGTGEEGGRECAGEDACSWIGTIYGTTSTNWIGTIWHWHMARKCTARTHALGLARYMAPIGLARYGTVHLRAICQWHIVPIQWVLVVPYIVPTQEHASSRCICAPYWAYTPHPSSSSGMACTPPQTGHRRRGSRA